MINKIRKSPSFFLSLVLSLMVIKLPPLRGYKLRLLATWSPSERHRRGFLDNFIWRAFFPMWWKREYYGEKNPDVREEKLFLVMGGNAGISWAEAHDATTMEDEFAKPLGDLSYWDHYPVFGGVQKILGKSPEGEGFCVVELGSSSGREIDWVARNFPKARCIGIDNVPEVVEYAASAHRLPNLEFQVLSMRNLGSIIENNPDCKWVVFATGTLQYIQPEHLSQFFRGLSSAPNLEVLTCGEVFSDVQFGSASAGEFLAYSHDYLWYAEQAGFKTLEDRQILQDHPTRQDRPYYYWRGKSPGSTARELQN